MKLKERNVTKFSNESLHFLLIMQTTSFSTMDVCIVLYFIDPNLSSIFLFTIVRLRCFAGPLAAIFVVI